jgi:phosphoglycolate phosphatase-like HAD superfamily hydrolase
MGYQTVSEVVSKLEAVNFALGDASTRLMGRGRLRVGSMSEKFAVAPVLFYVAFGHPKASIECFKEDSNWRKPGGGMIVQAMRDYRVEPEDVLFVGDMDTDREAAKNAGVAYQDAEEFFG